jgi:hypothetical protein
MNEIIAALTEIAAKDVKDGNVFPTSKSVAVLEKAVCADMKLASFSDPYARCYERPDGWLAATPPEAFVAQSTELFANVFREIEATTPTPTHIRVSCHNQKDNGRNTKEEWVKFAIRWC